VKVASEPSDTQPSIVLNPSVRYRPQENRRIRTSRTRNDWQAVRLRGYVVLIVGYLSGIDWAASVSGAVLGALGLGVRTVVQAPVKALTEHARVVRFLSFLSPQQPFSGQWRVAWKVESRRFPEVNEDTVRVFRLFSNVTFTTVATLRDGSSEICVFVGKLIDRTVTGRWYNPEDEDRGYVSIRRRPRSKRSSGVRISNRSGVWLRLRLSR
jgi:hypothetical protein